MKKAKIISMLLVLILCLPFAFACGGKTNDTGSTTAAGTTEAITTTEVPTTPAPTEPTTEKPTEPPTEPPTDPAVLAEPIQIGDYKIIPGARYYIWSPNSGMYLTVDGDFKYAGLSQEDYTGKPDQMFVFEYVRTDVVSETVKRDIFKIRSLGTKASYVDLDGGLGDADGTSVICGVDPEGAGSQEWFLKAQKKSKLMDTVDTKLLLDDFANVDLPLFSIMSGVAKSRCLDVSGVSKDAGGFIHLWNGGTANNQKWFFELVSDVESGKIVPRGLQENPQSTGAATTAAP